MSQKNCLRKKSLAEKLSSEKLSAEKMSCGKIVRGKIVAEKLSRKNCLRKITHVALCFDCTAAILDFKVNFELSCKIHGAWYRYIVV